jgi:hypothetical protein
MIRRRADAFAEAGIDTAIQFGFHFRFDFAPYFGAMHGLFADVANTLHERGIRFLDHYSCNLLARPNCEEERLRYHTHQRHHVDLYPDMLAAESAGYAGHRFRDLCEVDLVTGKPAYTPIYQAELLCHNNPHFLEMHAAYVKRLFAEVPLDGLQADDMCMYNYFRSCGCEFCRERFRREYGHELPPLDDIEFWAKTSGELDLWAKTSGDPMTWGNYGNQAFRDWVQMRYASPADHLKMIRGIIGPDKVLMTCCSTSGPQVLNAMAMSYEGVVDICDWVMLENCGLSANTVNWALMEPEAILQKSIALVKPNEPAATVACSYTVYDDGAYLGWALARFWGVTNWISTLTTGLLEDPGDAKEEAELISPYNNWELQHEIPKSCTDVVDIRIAFLRANRDCAQRDKNGVEYWERTRRWGLECTRRNIGYRFTITRELEKSKASPDDGSPLVLDGCACMSDTEYSNIKRHLDGGGRVWIVPPFGTHTEKGATRPTALLNDLVASGYEDSIVLLDEEWHPDMLDDLIEQGHLSPSIRIVGENQSWRARLRRTEGGAVIHLLNSDLAGIEHPRITDRWGRAKVLQSIRSTASGEPLKIELRLPCLNAVDIATAQMLSPELDCPRSLSQMQQAGENLSLEIDMSNIRLYGVINLSLKENTNA